MAGEATPQSPMALPAPLRALGRRAYVRLAHRMARTDLFDHFGAGSLIHPLASVEGHRHIHIGSQTEILRGSYLCPVTAWRGQTFEPTLWIGDRCRIGRDATLSCIERIEIQDDVVIGDRVLLQDTIHLYTNPDLPVYHQPTGEGRPIVIEQGVVLGHNIAVMRGVTIGRNSLVGVSSVVTKDVPANSLVVGNPARVIKRWDGNEWVDVDGDASPPG